MASERDEINKLLIELGKDVLRIVDNKVNDEIKEVYKKEVEYMYSEYEPRVYRRRYDDEGFLDERNWDVDIKLKRNGDIEYELINETETANPSAVYRLDEMIETGKVHAKIPKRPVYERTQDRIVSEGVVENILESELKKQGWDFK